MLKNHFFWWLTLAVVILRYFFLAMCLVGIVIGIGIALVVIAHAFMTLSAAAAAATTLFTVLWLIIGFCMIRIIHEAIDDYFLGDLQYYFANKLRHAWPRLRTPYVFFD